MAARALLAMGKGDTLVVAGELSIAVWTPEGKEPRPSLRVLAHQVLTPYAVQRRREAASGTRRERPIGGGMETAERLLGGERDLAERNHDGARW